MTTFTITVDDKAVQATLRVLSARVKNMNPVLQTLGMGIVERTQRRFDTSTDPAGQPWQPYPPGGATLALLAGRIAKAKSNRKKDGSLNAKGRTAYAGKKLLIGDSRHLKSSFEIRAQGNVLTVSSSMVYAAIHQFGGITGANSMIPGKKIPARPFLPVRQDGSLYSAEQSEIVKAIKAYLSAPGGG